MRVLADENIPGLEQALAGVGELRRCAGSRISADDLRDIDVLLVRSVTRVDDKLLRGSPVSFVGSCTTGVDHVDVEGLRQAGITFAHAPGANARSVVEYVLSALCWLALYRGLDLPRCSVGIVGLGHIGSRLYRLLSAAGLQCMGYDPLFDTAGRIPQSFSLEQVLSADIVTLHTPLTRSGAHPTWHLLDDRRLQNLRPGAVIINSCRGSVIDNAALCAQLEQGARLQVVLDVWEGEPAINRALLQHVSLATPHIAGYSYDGKLAGVDRVLRQLFATKGMTAVANRPEVSGSTALSELVGSDQGGATIAAPALNDEWMALCKQMLSIYSIGDDDRSMRQALLCADDPVRAFESLRRNYPIRRESSFYKEAGGSRTRVDVLQSLGS
jgi:erythronate-4-phosphate dehydrogenase